MKTILFTFVLPLALCAAVGATGQTKSAVSVPKADTVMLSETTEGDYFVRKYVVRSDADAGYSLYYKISSSNFVETFKDNSKEVNGLNAFVGSIDRDSLLHVRSVTITGYASPDGPMAMNKKLAKNRAQSLKAYVDKKYGLSKKYNVTTNSVATDWTAAREAIAKSDIPEKQAVLNIIDQRDAAFAKERRLKAMPMVWKYLAANILPSMRYSEIAIAYADGRLVEQRTIIPKSEPVPQPKAVGCCCGCPNPCIVVDESTTGILVEMDDVGVDF